MSQTITITNEDIIEQVKLSCKIPEIVEDIVTRKVVENAITEAGIKVEDEELQEAADKYRFMYQLESVEDTEKWLKKNHLSLDDFEKLIYNELLNTKLVVHLFKDKIEPYFYENQINYTGVIMYEVILDDEDLAMELFYAVKEGEMSFYDVAHKYIQDKELARKGGYQGIMRRKDLKPEISAAVFNANPPQVIKPIVTSKGVHLILVEKLIKAELDNFIRTKICSDLFNEWLKEKIYEFEVV